MANHYSKEDLELYRNHQMSILGRLTCQAHLKECPDCARLLQELSEDDDFIRQLRASAQIYEAIVKNESANKKLPSIHLINNKQETSMKHLPSMLTLICVALTAITFPITALSAETSNMDSIQKIALSREVFIEMVKVEAGTFEMSARDGENDSCEVAHQATLTKDFFIGKTEVTQAQWWAVMENNPSKNKGDDLPVEEVSWNEAMEFCNKLNDMDKAPKGWKFTLPTETQWEYAARGGKNSKGYRYSGSNDVGEVAWYKDNSDSKMHPVGQKKANELGLYDMSGNVYEWCLDNWMEDSSKLTSEFTRENDKTDSRRAMRGGSYYNLVGNCRSTCRDWNSPKYWGEICGFRLALVQTNSNKSGEKNTTTIQGGTPEQTTKKIELPNGVSLEMVKVESGTFEMSVMNGIKSGFGEVAHPATLTQDFFIGQTEVTQAQWKAVMEDNPSYFSFKGDNLPVVEVTWNRVMEFCEKLNATGKAPKGWKFTLPTETQWEYAARGGNMNKGYKYSGSNNIDEVAWYYGNSGNRRLDDSSWDLSKVENNNCKPHPVGQKKANELGLYDMSGNVYEWCLDDWLDKSDKLKAEFTRENDHGDSDRRAIRGGAFCYSSDLCHPARRNIGNISGSFDRSDFTGFRLALVQSNSDKTETKKTAPKTDMTSESDITSAEDQYLDGLIYYYNENYSEAAKCFKKAAEQGNAEAQFELGRCYCLGRGVTENQVEAVKWIRKAAEQGHVEAQGALGVFYYEGVGATKNQVEGIKLLRKAAEGGSKSARDYLRERGY